VLIGLPIHAQWSLTVSLVVPALQVTTGSALAAVIVGWTAAAAIDCVHRRYEGTSSQTNKARYGFSCGRCVSADAFRAQHAAVQVTHSVCPRCTPVSQHKPVSWQQSARGPSTACLLCTMPAQYQSHLRGVGSHYGGQHSCFTETHQCLVNITDKFASVVCVVCHVSVERLINQPAPASARKVG
jgi:hypothetical protein